MGGSSAIETAANSGSVENTAPISSIEENASTVPSVSSIAVASPQPSRRRESIRAYFSHVFRFHRKKKTTPSTSTVKSSTGSNTEISSQKLSGQQQKLPQSTGAMSKTTPVSTGSTGRRYNPNDHIQLANGREMHLETASAFMERGHGAKGLMQSPR